MLTQLEADNFKSWRELRLRLAPITGLFGANSSGKSSVLQLLLLLKQTKEATDRSLALELGGPHSYTSLGTFHDVAHRHADDTALRWRVDWTFSSELLITDPTGPKGKPLFKSEALAVEAEVGLRGQQLTTKYIRYEFAGQRFELIRKESRPSAFSLQSDGKVTGFGFIRKQGRAWDIPGPVKSYAFPEQAKTYFQNADFLGDLELSYESLMDSIYYLGPLREFPKRDYTWSGASPMDVGQRGERVVDAMLAARSRNEQRNLGYRKRYRPFEAIIAHWLKELGLIESFQVREIGEHLNLYRVEIQKERGAPPVLVTDVGFGVSQFLPVLVLLYYVPEGSIVLLEQPEIHLHPSVQSRLADVIINVVKNRNVQVIVESHSEHLLRRFQRRVAEQPSDLTPQDLALYFCEMKDGESKLMPLEIDPYGSIVNWPQDFFGDEFGEVAAIQEAGLKRKLAGQ
jgi:predicted ATPase